MRPNLSYLIMATPRSGSYLLCEALINTNRAGRPTEYFSPFQARSLLKNWGQPDYATYLGQIIEEGTTPNGVFGAKIIWQFFEDFIDRLRAISGNEKLPTPQLLSTTFPHLSYLWIRRRDKVRQAVSFWKALQNNNWVEFEGTPSLLQKRMPVKDWQQHHAMQEALFDYKAIERLRRLLEEDEVEMQQFFAACGVHPFKIIYEDFVNNYEETILQVLDYLQIPVSEQLVFGERKLKKQADEQSEEWVQRYYAMWQQDDNKQRNVEGEQ